MQMKYMHKYVAMTGVPQGGEYGLYGIANHDGRVPGELSGVAYLCEGWFNALIEENKIKIRIYYYDICAN